MSITRDLIESLLLEEESTSLDFKQAQYPFDRATDEQKSELLKDLLAFANAFRRSDAFILLGVKEVKGSRSQVVGVHAQLDDANLQQFVASKVQRPLQFSYRAAEHDGLAIGVIHIPQQRRPIYAKRSYGKVIRDVVYLRRGSSTGIATPDEIAAMGADRTENRSPEPALELALFDRRTGQLLGKETSIGSTVLDVRNCEHIPDYRESGSFLDLHAINNEDYWRQLAEYLKITLLVHPIALSVRNTGEVAARDVRVLMKVSDPLGIYEFREEAGIPCRPRRKRHPLELDRIDCLRSVHDPFDITVERVVDTWEIEVEFGRIQPQDTVKHRQDLHIGARKSGTLSLEPQIFADNLSQPQGARIQLEFKTVAKSALLEELDTM